MINFMRCDSFIQPNWVRRGVCSGIRIDFTNLSEKKIKRLMSAGWCEPMGLDYDIASYQTRLADPCLTEQEKREIEEIF